MRSISLLLTSEVTSGSSLVRLLSISDLSSDNAAFSSETLFKLAPPNSSEITLEVSFFRE